MSERTAPNLDRSPDLLRAPARKVRRLDPGTQDATIPMLYEPCRVSYARSEPPPPKRSFARFVRALAIDTRADLVRIAAFSRMHLERARDSLESRATVGIAAASLGLCTGMLLMHEPTPSVSAVAEPPSAIAVESQDAMCSAPAPLTVELAHAAAPKPTAEARAPQVKRQVTPASDVRAKPIRLAKGKLTRAEKPPAMPARRRALVDEAMRAERAELASAAPARRSARP